MPPPKCPSCGYDLLGSPRADACPECGKPVRGPEAPGAGTFDIDAGRARRLRTRAWSAAAAVAVLGGAAAALLLDEPARALIAAAVLAAASAAAALWTHATGP